MQSFLEQQNQSYYLFDPTPYGKIFTFVDFGNVRYWAKSFWPTENREYFKKEIDIEKLAKTIRLVTPSRMYFYYGHYKGCKNLPHDDPINVKFRQSIYRVSKAQRVGFKTRTKEIKEIDHFDEEGRYIGKKYKCNFDVEMTMDILQQMRKFDSIFLWSGDSDFHSLLSYLKTKQIKTVTVCARDFASDELEQNSDLFIPADPMKDILEYIPIKSTPDVSREA